MLSLRLPWRSRSFAPNLSARSSISSFGWQQPEPLGAMQVPRHRPRSPGPLGNVNYLFPPAPYVRLPPRTDRKQALQPREEWSPGYLEETFMHPLDYPKRSVSTTRSASSKRERVSQASQTSLRSTAKAPVLPAIDLLPPMFGWGSA